MTIWKTAASFILLCLIVAACPAWSASSAEGSFLLFTSDNIDRFELMLKNAGEKSCVIIQVPPERMDDTKAGMLMKWVARGGIIWFYDSRLASFFSMKDSSFDPCDLPCKHFEGEYGTEKKCPGIALGAEAWGNHSITVGVRKVVVFSIRVEGDEKRGKYSAVADGEGTIPLLKVNRNDHFSIAAIRPSGKGYVIFKPLLWEDQFDGRDFQRKLVRFSDRKPVPFSR